MSRSRNARKPSAAPTARFAGVRWAAYAGLVVGCLVIYGQTVHFAFLPYDDNTYLTGNPHVAGGLTWDNVVWAFTSFEASNWVPLTWLSHMLDFQLFGSQAGAHHLVNAVLHAANAVLLLWVMTQLLADAAGSRFLRCFWVAALFAFHPLHVQSVAWVSQRKDVLSLFFALLALGMYARYSRRPNVWRYVSVSLCYALSLMAKPMMVTLPILLLLLDYWPLSRLEGVRGERFGKLRRLLLEKAPLFLIALAVGVVAIVSNRHGDRLEGMMPLGGRLGVAALAYGWYAVKTVLPSGLAVMYPYPMHGLPWWLVAGGVILLLATTLLVLVNIRRRPYLFAGWAWYLVTVLPVSGLVQIHMEPYADRYSYVPIVGLFIMAAWGFAELVSRMQWSGKLLVGVGAACAIACLPISAAYTSTWRDGETLFNRATRVSPGSPSAHIGLGNALAEEERYEEALKAYETAYRLAAEEAHPAVGLAVMNAGLAEFALSARCDDQGRQVQLLDDSLKRLRVAVELRPGQFEPWYNLGNVLAALAVAKAGASEPQEAIRLLDEACAAYDRALTVRANDYRALYNWGNALQTLGQSVGGDAGVQKLREAAKKYEEAIGISPDCVECYGNGGSVLIRLAGMETGPEADALLDKAEEWLARAEGLRPGNGCYNMACLKALRGDTDGCRAWLEKARRYGTLPTAAQMQSDPDLSRVRQQPWFTELLKASGE